MLLGKSLNRCTLTLTGLSPSTAPLSNGLQLPAHFLTVSPAGRPTRMLPQPPPRNPCRVSHVTGLASSDFARHYSRNHFCFLFLWVLRCFTSPRSLYTPYFIQARVTGHDSSRVSPFGHPRITAWLPTPQGLSQAPTSFIGSRCQGIHHVPLIACQYKHSTNNTKTHLQFIAHTTHAHPQHTAPHPHTKDVRTRDQPGITRVRCSRPLSTCQPPRSNAPTLTRIHGHRTDAFTRHPPHTTTTEAVAMPA